MTRLLLFAALLPGLALAADPAEDRRVVAELVDHLLFDAEAGLDPSDPLTFALTCTSDPEDLAELALEATWADTRRLSPASRASLARLAGVASRVVGRPPGALLARFDARFPGGPRGPVPASEPLASAWLALLEAGVPPGQLLARLPRLRDAGAPGPVLLQLEWAARVVLRRGPGIG